MIPNCSKAVFKGWEIAVMGTLVTCDLPHVFYRIQIRAVRRQKVRFHDVAMFMQPRLQLSGMAPPGVVHDKQHLSVLPSVAHQVFQEQIKRRRVKAFFAARHKISVLNTDGSEQRHPFACRGIE
mgnify:CR=1 FL=1